MIFALLIAVPLIVGAPWIFLYFSPRTRDRRRLRRVNASVIGIALLVCAVTILWVRSTLAGTEDVEWWPVVALAFCAVVFPGVFLIGGLVRNFVIFR